MFLLLADHYGGKPSLRSRKAPDLCAKTSYYQIVTSYDKSWLQ